MRAMVLSLALILLGILLLLGGGETLLRGAVGVATLLRLTPAVIGMTVVAAGTSVPELAVSATAAVAGEGDIAVANVIGSNIFNITVILGLCAVIAPLNITGNTIKLEYPVLAVVTLLCIVIARDGRIGRLDALLLLSVYVSFTLYLVVLVRKQISATEAQELKAEVSELTPVPPGTEPALAAPAHAATANDPAPPAPRAWLSIGLVIGGIVLLGAGAHATVTGAVGLARMLGWSERLIGLTIVSIGTGLPEVVASLVSSARGRSDVAIGNVIGSNLFNILAILGLSGLAIPLPVSRELVASDCVWMMGVTIMLFPLLYTHRRVSRGEGIVLLAVYVVYLMRLLGSSS
jgi:cation:H+ antiporter